MRVFRRSRVLLVLLVLGLVVTACGTDEGEGSTTTSTSEVTTTTATETSTTTPESPPVSLEGEVNDHGTATVEGGSIEIEQDDFYFEPTFIEADPGATVDVELTNEGTEAHTFTIDDQDIEIELEPGQSETMEVTIPDSGSLRFYCRFHESQGMQGALFASGS